MSELLFKVFWKIDNLENFSLAHGSVQSKDQFSSTGSWSQEPNNTCTLLAMYTSQIDFIINSLRLTMIGVSLQLWQFHAIITQGSLVRLVTGVDGVRDIWIIRELETSP